MSLPLRLDSILQRAIVVFLLIHRHHIHVTTLPVGNDPCVHGSFADTGILKDKQHLIYTGLRGLFYF